MSQFTWHRRSLDCIAQGALTNSKRPESLVKGVYPTHLKRGLGSFVWDTDGKRYVDFICGLGTNILGYGNAEVNEAIASQARNGASLSLSTELEVLAAEKVKEVFPFVDHVKFLKTGSEACSAAIRIARAYTGRKIVLSEGYHGWHDEFTGLDPMAEGVPPSHVRKLGSLDDIDSIVAAVIVEPIMTDCSDARIKWLWELKERCKKSGALLIFDEVITGFRFPKLSASAFYGIQPDMVCIGKAMANGMPLAAVGGKKEVMNGNYFVSSTYAGETLSLAAALKTMTLLQTKYDLMYLWQQGIKFIGRFNALWPGHLAIHGYGTRGVFVGDPMTKALFWQEACRSGILFGPSFFFNFGHIDETDSVISTSRDIITRIQTGSVKLEGEMPTSPFAQRMRGNK